MFTKTVVFTVWFMFMLPSVKRLMEFSEAKICSSLSLWSKKRQILHEYYSENSSFNGCRLVVHHQKCISVQEHKWKSTDGYKTPTPSESQGIPIPSKEWYVYIYFHILIILRTEFKFKDDQIYKKSSLFHSVVLMVVLCLEWWLALMDELGQLFHPCINTLHN